MVRKTWTGIEKESKAGVFSVMFTLVIVPVLVSFTTELVEYGLHISTLIVITQPVTLYTFVAGLTIR